MSIQKLVFSVGILIGFSGTMIKGMEVEESPSNVRRGVIFEAKYTVNSDSLPTVNWPTTDKANTSANNDFDADGSVKIEKPDPVTKDSNGNLVRDWVKPKGSPVQVIDPSTGNWVKDSNKKVTGPENKQVKTTLLVAWARNNKLKAALIVEGVALTLDAAQATGKSLYKWYAKNEAFSPVKVAQEMYHVKGAKALYHAAHKAFRRA